MGALLPLQHPLLLQKVYGGLTTRGAGLYPGPMRRLVRGYMRPLLKRLVLVKLGVVLRDGP
jgi:hypothetical protein